MNQTSTNRINLPIVKHHFTLANSRDVDRENCVSSRLRTQDRGQLADWRNGCDCLGITTVYSDRDHATTSRSTSIVLATSLTYGGLYLKFFFLRHDVSLQTFSDRLKLHSIATFVCRVSAKLPRTLSARTIVKPGSAYKIGNRHFLPIADGLHFKAISVCPSYEERGNAGFLMDRLDRFRQKRRDT